MKPDRYVLRVVRDWGPPRELVEIPFEVRSDDRSIDAAIDRTGSPYADPSEWFTYDIRRVGS